MKLHYKIFFLFLFLVFSDRYVKAEILFAIKIASADEIKVYLNSSSNNNSLLGKYLKLFLDAEINTLTGNNNKFIDKNQPVYAFWGYNRNNPLTVFSVVIVPVVSPNDFISTLSPEYMTRIFGNNP